MYLNAQVLEQLRIKGVITILNFLWCRINLIPDMVKGMQLHYTFYIHRKIPDIAFLGNSSILKLRETKKMPINFRKTAMK